jgi:hypothetical protein
MHKVEQFINGAWVVTVEFSELTAARAYARRVNGLVIPKEWDVDGSEACYQRLDWMESNCGWFCAADEFPR